MFFMSFDIDGVVEPQPGGTAGEPSIVALCQPWMKPPQTWIILATSDDAVSVRYRIRVRDARNAAGSAHDKQRGNTQFSALWRGQCQRRRSRASGARRNHRRSWSFP